MSHQFEFQCAYNTGNYWRHVDHQSDTHQELGGVYPSTAQGTIETMFNVVPGNLCEKIIINIIITFKISEQARITSK